MNYTGTVSDEGRWEKNEWPQQNNKYLALEVMAKRGWMEIYIGDAQWNGDSKGQNDVPFKFAPTK